MKKPQRIQISFDTTEELREGLRIYALKNKTTLKEIFERYARHLLSGNPQVPEEPRQ
ncbi:MAG: hypothetical protein SVS15_07015 [Thermodesulfobacteriota bacterium]|nr:hypothetical protein [Thermodesulfobacteriota bacterium]